MKALILFFLSIAIACAAQAAAPTAEPFTPITAPDTTILGRWDITIQQNNRETPSWLEVILSGNRTLVGRFVSNGGSARPISRVEANDGKFSFSIPPQWEREDHDLSVECHREGDNLVGTVTYPDGKQYPWTGRRAPSLKRTKAPVWGAPRRLFDGTTLKGWHALNTTNQWEASNGILRSPHSGSNIATDETFTDFKLHIEFRFPKGSNSGVYLRGRYETQIQDTELPEPPNNQMSSIYGFLSPNEQAAKKAGEWQSYDITLVGRLVTIVFNGKTVITRQEIPGITGGALDSREGEPGPIYLQGDHGPIEYRNITITRAQ
ncbi:MAG: DUF1080 domain-containing protein [Bacteroidetes bacterium]|nr:DUF1080 domain-containing protein [Bacteroidota bacterium]